MQGRRWGRERWGEVKWSRVEQSEVMIKQYIRGEETSGMGLSTFGDNGRLNSYVC